MKKNLFQTCPEKESTEINNHQGDENDIVGMRNVIIFILYLEGEIKKYNTYDGKPEKPPEHLDFFHYNSL